MDACLERLRQEELVLPLPSLRYRYARVCGVPAEQAMEVKRSAGVYAAQKGYTLPDY